MKLNKTIKLLICFVIILPYFVNGQASASSTYNHDALMEYEGYGKAMFDSVVEQTTFLSGQYTDNKGYVRDSINQVKEYADFWYNEYNDFTSSCYQSSAMSCLGEMVERGGAYVLTVGDWAKKLFGDYGETLPQSQELDYSMFGNAFYYDEINGTAVLKEGWSATATAGGVTRTFGSGGVIRVTIATNTREYPHYYFYYLNAGTSILYTTEQVKTTDAKVVEDEHADWRAKYYSGVSGMLQLFYENGGSLSLEYQGELQTSLQPMVSERPIDAVNRYLADIQPEVALPQLQPQLVCPDGTKIQMSVSGSTFLSVDGTTMVVNKDGTAQVNSEICNLDWQKPKVDYVNDVAAVTDSKGNWLEIGTNTVLACLDPAGCELAPMDNSLLDYVKNGYNYATGVLKNATDGLKSLATGAKDLTALFGTFFSWLPNEMVVLMASGLGITVGLRLFRK